MVAGIVFAGILVGGVFQNLFGWFISQEPYDRIKLLSTVQALIYGTVALAPSMIGGSVQANSFGLLGIFIACFLAGCGIDTVYSHGSKIASTEWRAARKASKLGK